MDGKPLWSKDLGDKKMRNQFGEGSTPVLAGDRLVIAQRARTRGKGSGIETELPYAVAYWFRGGTILEIKEFRTKDEALEAVGLSAPGAHA